MKKFLLSAMAFMLLATGANAQNFNKTDKEAAPATFSSLSSVAAHQNGPKKLADNQKLLGWSGSTGDAGIGSTGFSSWVSANGIFSDYSRDYSKLKG